MDPDPVVQRIRAAILAHLSTRLLEEANVVGTELHGCATGRNGVVVGLEADDEAVASGEHGGFFSGILGASDGDGLRVKVAHDVAKHLEACLEILRRFVVPMI